VGGKCASLLEFSKLSAAPRREDSGMFVTVVFLRLKPVGGANANFEAALEGGEKVSKNLVVGIVKVEDGVVSNVRFLFTGKLLALNPLMEIGHVYNLVGARRSCKQLPFSVPQEHSRRTIHTHVASGNLKVVCD
jgi:hypothetical protein